MNNLFQNFNKPNEEKKKEENVSPTLNTTQNSQTQPQKEDSGYEFLVKEIKETYQLYQLDDKLILDALKKAEGDVEKAMTILFS